MDFDKKNTQLTMENPLHDIPHTKNGGWCTLFLRGIFILVWIFEWFYFGFILLNAQFSKIKILMAQVLSRLPIYDISYWDSTIRIITREYSYWANLDFGFYCLNKCPFFKHSKFIGKGNICLHYKFKEMGSKVTILHVF